MLTPERENRVIGFPAETPSGDAMPSPPSPDARQAPRPAQRQSSAQSLSGARLRKHADYQRAYAASRKRQSASMSWFLAPQQPVAGALPAASRVGLTVGKVIGKAHERNRIKRRMREALRRHLPLLPQGCDLIFHPRRFVLTLEFAKLEAEIVRILEQANAEVARLAGRPVQLSARQIAPPKPSL
jgi:ribonuclease P protein component